MELKEIFKAIKKITEEFDQKQNQKINLFHKQFNEEIKNIGSILEGIEISSFGKFSPHNNTNISNDKKIFNFFIFLLILIF